MLSFEARLLLRCAWLALLVATPPAAAENAPCATPPADADWAVSSPEAAGFDAPALCAVLEKAANETANLHAVLVERHGKLVAELYRTGSDDPIDVAYGLGNPFAADITFDANALHDVRSVSKSVVSLLVGIAMRDGKIGPLSSSVLAAYPELADLRSEGRDAITIEQLLTMSSGLDWNEWGAGTLTSDETRLFWKSDQVRFLFDRALVAAPGARFNYNGGGTATLADLLVRATGKPLVEFAREQLFEPLGITHWEWARDYRDRPLAFAGLRMRPRDMAKLGRLVLDRGRWRGRQVVPEVWIAESLRPHVSTGDAFPPVPSQPNAYGYQWWAGRIAWRGRDVAWNEALGNGGQRIYVVPELDLTVVITAGAYGQREIGRTVAHLFAGVVAATAE